MSQPLSHSDLLRILEEYLTSDLTKYATEKKYGLYQGCITYWLRTFGLDDKPKNEDIMVEQPSLTQKRCARHLRKGDDGRILDLLG